MYKFVECEITFVYRFCSIPICIYGQITKYIAVSLFDHIFFRLCSRIRRQWIVAL